MTADRSQRHLRSALVIAEVALALMLVSAPACCFAASSTCRTSIAGFGATT
jgi:hypothetical protein